MFPWSDHCLYERARRRRRLGDEQEVLEKWNEDLCSGEELPEVEIISLVEEQIPKYKLRADTLTSFTGYENQDWFIPDPALKPEDIDSPLTPEQIRETFNYFLLCSTRVSQMSKTYNDIEAVTRLLEEKEKDIELTARIGKELLAHNAKLEGNVATLETELRQSNEKITQLSHELLKKTELVQILTNDVDDSGSEGGTPTCGLKTGQFEMLQRRISDLESENVSLRGEAQRLAADTEDCEQHEARLVNDLVTQIERIRAELGQSGAEAEAWRSREAELSNQIQQLQTRLRETDLHLAQALKENEEYRAMISIGRETQSELASELADVKERYSELLSIVKELRENAVKTNKKSQPKVRVGGAYPSLHTSVPTQNPDSLAAELECSLFSELSLDSGIGASTGPIPNYKKVFETVRCASRAGSSSGEVSDASSPAPRLGMAVLTPSRPRPTATVGPQPPMILSTDEIQYNNILGKPSPSDDLESALKGLTPAAIDARRAAMSSSSFLGEECPTPDSIMSTGSSGYAPWKLPDKLQIVKPVEGSLTLHQWSELATPSLGGLLEERPGVKVRGGTDLETLGIKMYSLSDVEEDDDMHPGKSFQDTSHIYTYTNSTVMHPDDNTIMTMSIRGSQMSVSTVGSRMSSMAPTPISRSRRNSTSTKSTTPGLAALLQERGIKAATPSTFISPTATPCNSPDRSPSPVSDDEGSFLPLGLPGFLMASGAEMLRRALGKSVPITALARPDKKAGLTGIRLVEKLERMGLEEILTSPNQGVALHQAGLRRATRALHSGGGVLGVPGRPGRGELEARLAADGGRGGVARGLRPDLGSVPSHQPGPPGAAPPSSTLSSLLFARKGGLL